MAAACSARRGSTSDRRASRLSTSHASVTSSSVVRKLPTARRRTKRSPSFVCERKASPDRFTRSRSRSLSSSEPSRRKQTSEKCLRATTSQPGSSRTQPSKSAGEPEMLANPLLQAGAAVAAQHGPELERTEPAAEHLRVLARAHDVLADAEVLGHEAERVAERLLDAASRGSSSRSSRPATCGD